MDAHHERRHSPRYKALKGTLLAFLSHSREENEGGGVLLDACKDGCRIASDVPLIVGHYYRLIIQALSGQPVTIETAMVCWSHKLVSGLKFITVDQDQEELVHQYLLELKRLGFESEVL